MKLGMSFSKYILIVKYYTVLEYSSTVNDLQFHINLPFIVMLCEHSISYTLNTTMLSIFFICQNKEYRQYSCIDSV